MTIIERGDNAKCDMCENDNLEYDLTPRQVNAATFSLHLSHKFIYSCVDCLYLQFAFSFHWWVCGGGKCSLTHLNCRWSPRRQGHLPKGSALVSIFILSYPTSSFL